MITIKLSVATYRPHILPGRGEYKYIGEHMREQKAHEKGSVFAVECVKQGMHLGV